MNYITNKTELKEYILRQLGSESHIVEISDTNFDDIYNKALNYLYERSSDGVIRKVVLIDGITEKDIFLNNNVMSINKIVTIVINVGPYQIIIYFTTYKKITFQLININTQHPNIIIHYGHYHSS